MLMRAVEDIRRAGLSNVVDVRGRMPQEFVDSSFDGVRRFVAFHLFVDSMRGAHRHDRGRRRRAADSVISTTAWHGMALVRTAEPPPPLRSGAILFEEDELVEALTVRGSRTCASGGRNQRSLVVLAERDQQ